MPMQRTLCLPPSSPKRLELLSRVSRMESMSKRKSHCRVPTVRRLFLGSVAAGNLAPFAQGATG